MNQGARETERDKRLEALALKAQNNTVGSKERQKYLTMLTNEIQKTNCLRCKNSFNFSFDVYQEVFHEAFQQTLLEVFIKIDQYDPHKGKVIQWIYSKLQWRFIDACKEHLKLRSVQSQGEQVRIYEQSLDIPIKSSQTSISSTSLLETIEQSESSNFHQNDWKNVWDLIRTDPTSCFEQAHIENHPKANFQAIALNRFDGKSWKDMSAEWEIPIPTLSRFYQRCIKKFNSVFKEYL